MTQVQPQVQPAAVEPGARQRWLCRLGMVGTVLLGAPALLATLLSLAAPAAWWLDLLTHFRPQYAMLLLLAAGAQVLFRPRALAAAWGAGLLLNLALLSPLLLADRPSASGRPLTIVHVNLGRDDVDVETLAEWVAEVSPELLSLQEVTAQNLPRIEKALTRAGVSYQTLAAQARADTRGVALLSRRRLALAGVSAQVIAPTPDAQRPMIQAHVELDGVPVAILGFHTTRPAPGKLYDFQAEGMSTAALWASANELAGAQTVLIGDFNSTSQGTLVRNLCHRAGLQDARRGHGLHGTWPASFPAPVRVPIDGAYHSGGLTATAFAVGPDVGSDHRPITVTLRLRDGFTPTAPPRFPPRVGASPASSPSPAPAETPSTGPAGSRRE